MASGPGSVKVPHIFSSNSFIFEVCQLQGREGWEHCSPGRMKTMLEWSSGKQQIPLQHFVGNQSWSPFGAVGEEHYISREFPVVFLLPSSNQTLRFHYCEAAQCVRLSQKVCLPLQKKYISLSHHTQFSLRGHIPLPKTSLAGNEASLEVAETSQYLPLTQQF